MQIEASIECVVSEAKAINACQDLELAFKEWIGKWAITYAINTSEYKISIVKGRF